MHSRTQSHQEHSDIRRLQEHGPAELAEQFSAAKSRLRKMVSVQVDSRITTQAVVSDVIQDAFAEASRRLPEYLKHPKTSPFIWLRQITRRVIAFHCQQSHNSETPTGSALPASSIADSVIAQIDRSPTSCLSAVDRQKLANRLIAIVETMQPEEREILALKQFEQLSYEEIAMELNISIHTAMRRFQRAVLRLGELAEHLEDC